MFYGGGGRALGFGRFDDGDIKNISFTMRNVLISCGYEERSLVLKSLEFLIGKESKGFLFLFGFFTLVQLKSWVYIIEFEPIKKRDKYEFYEIKFGFSLGLES